MKKVTLVAAFLLASGSAAVMADDSILASLEGERGLTQLTEQELASTQGQGGGFFWGAWGHWGDVCVTCSNTAVLSQLNVSLNSIAALQGNTSMIMQSNN